MARTLTIQEAATYWRYLGSGSVPTFTWQAAPRHPMSFLSFAARIALMAA